MRRDQKLRYGCAAGLIVLGFVCAAVSTGTLGGALATVFVGVGMLLFLIFLFGDLGLSIDAKPRRRVVPPPPDHAGPGSRNGHPGREAEMGRVGAESAAATADGRRSRAPVRRSDRLRGDRRRLR